MTDIKNQFDPILRKLIKNKKIPNYYEFKHNLELSKSNNLGFASRCEGRKNPHYLDGLKSYVFS